MFGGIKSLFFRRRRNKTTVADEPKVTKPKIDVSSGKAEKSDSEVVAGWANTRGRRSYNEDNIYCDFCAIEKEGKSLEVGCLGVFDGHGGAVASAFLKENLFHSILHDENFPKDIFKAIEGGFVNTDAKYTMLDAVQQNDDGSTATAALMIDDYLYVAHVGDSRAVLCKNGKAVTLTEDHKPDRYDERRRIENIGGTVIHAGTWRVGGVLAVSRSFGNRMMKDFIVALPEIRLDRLQYVSCVILATDGLWDVFTEEEAIEFADRYDDAETAARELVLSAYEKGSYDNISCIVCYLKREHSGTHHSEHKAEECRDTAAVERNYSR